MGDLSSRCRTVHVLVVICPVVYRDESDETSDCCENLIMRKIIFILEANQLDSCPWWVGYPL